MMHQFLSREVPAQQLPLQDPAPGSEGKSKPKKQEHKVLSNAKGIFATNVITKFHMTAALSSLYKGAVTALAD